MTELAECPRCHRLFPVDSLVQVTADKHKGLGGASAVVSVCESCFQAVKGEIGKQWVADHFGPKDDPLSEKQLREQNRHHVSIRFRIHAYTKDLDLPLVRGILQMPADNSMIRRRYEDEHDGIAGIEFQDDPPFQTWREIEEWQRPAFRNTVEWVRTKSVKDIQALYESGLRADICISGSLLGRIPRELIKEIARLNLDFFLIPMPSDA